MESLMTRIVASLSLLNIHVLTICCLSVFKYEARRLPLGYSWPCLIRNYLEVIILFYFSYFFLSSISCCLLFFRLKLSVLQDTCSSLFPAWRKWKRFGLFIDTVRDSWRSQCAYYVCSNHTLYIRCYLGGFGSGCGKRALRTIRLGFFLSPWRKIRHVFTWKRGTDQCRRIVHLFDAINRWSLIVSYSPERVKTFLTKYFVMPFVSLAFTIQVVLYIYKKV